MSQQLPAIKAKKLLTVLTRLGYEVTRQSGSHRTLEGPGLPKLLFSFHDGDEVGPVMLKKILVKDVGLTADEAFERVKG